MSDSILVSLSLDLIQEIWIPRPLPRHSEFIIYWHSGSVLGKYVKTMKPFNSLGSVLHLHAIVFHTLVLYSFHHLRSALGSLGLVAVPGKSTACVHPWRTHRAPNFKHYR